MTFGTAVVVGKFCPPHRGHQLLVDTALAQAGKVTVIVCAKPDDPVPGELRGQWLREIHPDAHVLVIDDRHDENDQQVWAANTIRWLGGPPDAVFSSEDYGETYARAMGSVHVPVDRQRTRVPCSSTLVRKNPFAMWDYLEAPVRAWYALRVCVVGAESTGTTTLAEALARHYGTVWVPEYGREYSVEKQVRGDDRWTSEEFVHVAGEQQAREERAAREANRVLICDTNAFATALWHRRYVGHDDERVRAATSGARCDLYLLTGDEIPFVQDGLRDGEHLRHGMHRWFEEALRAQATPWLLLRGPLEGRLTESIAAIDALLVDALVDALTLR
jgi:HTH-type transcriptional regulator, transcriptional repressor of NAD biosynthesis genes